MFLSEETSRKVFIASFVALALPSIVLIAAAAGAGSAVWAFFAVVEVARAFSAGPAIDGGSMPSALSLTYLPAVAIVGLVALWKFVLVSSRYVADGRSALLENRGLLKSALAWAIVPTLAATSIAFLVLDGGEPLFELGRIYLSGLPLLVPLSHLFLELKRCAQVNATQASPASLR